MSEYDLREIFWTEVHDAELQAITQSAYWTISLYFSSHTCNERNFNSFVSRKGEKKHKVLDRCAQGYANELTATDSRLPF